MQAAAGVKSDRFYSAIASFGEFRGITEDAHFRAVPADWKVVVADISGSTAAIEAGRYKDVNMLGAASIVCAQKGMDDLELPFVFGGDGATLLVPSSRIDRVSEELAALQELSGRSFDLALRVGVVGVDELLAEGCGVEVARFEVAGGRSIAIFRGGGLTLAERKIKEDSARYAVSSPGTRRATALPQLSCRWQAIPSSRGEVLSLLVVASSESDAQATYRETLRHFEEILDGGLETAHPVAPSGMKYKGFLQCVREEVRLFESAFSRAFLEKLIEIAWTVLVLKWGLPAVVFDAVGYRQSIPAHSDYRKFDDALRMVIDCTIEQGEEIRQCLEAARRRGELLYGLHSSASSLVTCYVDSTTEGEHLHFVDGGDGGYAMAAKQLKTQLEEASRGVDG